MKQRKIEEYTQRTPPAGGAPEERRKDDKTVTVTSNPQRKERCNRINRKKNSIFNFLHVSPRIVVENASIDNPTHNLTDPNKRSPILVSMLVYPFMFCLCIVL